MPAARWSTHNFERAARRVAKFTASPQATLVSLLTVILWLLAGPKLHFSDTWQLVIGSISSAITFVMVFVLNNEQVRDTNAINAKLDVIIRALAEAPNHAIGIDREASTVVEDLRKLTQGEA